MILQPSDIPADEPLGAYLDRLLAEVCPAPELPPEEYARPDITTHWEQF